MGYVLSIAVYFVFALILFRLLARITLWLKAPPEPEMDQDEGCASVFMAFIDVLFLRRLFLVNKTLWIGEWAFHVSFVFVVLRHLRYATQPVPECIFFLQPLGVFAGYVLPVSLLYILIYRLLTPDRYRSAYNLFLTVILLFTGLTGILLHTVLRTDLLAVKAFTVSTLVFSPKAAPGDVLFIIHMVLALIFLLWLPSHIMAAPITAYGVRRRDEETETLLQQGEPYVVNHEKI